MGVMGKALQDMRESLEGKQYVERYVQTLTHELKSPLAAIGGAAELLTEEMTPTERGRFLANIRTEAGRMQGIVERMLQLSALESRKGLKSIEEIDIGQLIAAIVEEARPLLLKKSLQINTAVSPDARLHGERFLIRQALANLVGNAIDFSPPHAVILLMARHEAEYLSIEVADAGPGIPPYAVEKIFERFYSLPRPDTGRKSTGLGLSFVREVASLHHGTISVVNRSEGGVIALLRLPLLQSAS
jgi:two-component system sensor histidine kinase CreC